MGRRSRSNRMLSPNNILLLLLGCVWSLATVSVSAFRPGLISISSNSHSTTPSTNTKRDTNPSAVLREQSCCSYSASGSASGSASASASALSARSRSTTEVEAVPSERKRRSFTRILRRRKSRRSTRRGFRNDGDGLIVVEEVVVASDDETETETETKTKTQAAEQKLGGATTTIVGGPDADAHAHAEIGDRIRAIGLEISHAAPKQPTNKTKRLRNVAYFASSLAKNNMKLRKNKADPVVIETVDELRHAILDQQLSLADTVIVERSKTSTNTNEKIETSETKSRVLDHAVRDLIRERFESGSTPGHRLPEDTATLAVAIEGGGMRGCVSAGMVAAITALGLSDSIDSIYGSSAGSVIGAYVVSRQVCLDVYVDILPASKELFVCKKRMVTNLASMGLGRMLLGNNSKSSRSKAGQAQTQTQKQKQTQTQTQAISNNNTKMDASSSPQTKTLRDRLLNTPPGMNISFVLDGILGDDHGLRPLDVDTFRKNNVKQKLRVVSSSVDPRTGKLVSRCFGGYEDFFCPEKRMVRVDGQQREGLFACLQASMTVPGATGPPINLVRKNEASSSEPTPCFDAFCFEPIPYRSAVEEGASHVLVLASRPEDYIPKTKPGIYDTGIAPLYFHSHGQRSVAEYFEQGGQQYVYAEDLMLLQEAKFKGNEGILVPPPEILYGVPRTTELDRAIREREQTWKKAHLFPLRVPKGYKELEALEQDKDAVLEAVRDGFMTAFDSLKDIVGLEDLDGTKVAELVFPASGNVDGSAPEGEGIRTGERNTASSMSSRKGHILRTKVHVPGEHIPESRRAQEENESPSTPHSEGTRRRIFPRRVFRRGRLGGLFGHGKHDGTDGNSEVQNESGDPEMQAQAQSLWQGEDLSRNALSASVLLQSLPGFRDGNYAHLAKGLIDQHQQQTTRTFSNSAV